MDAGKLNSLRDIYYLPVRQGMKSEAKTLTLRFFFKEIGLKKNARSAQTLA